MTYGAEIWGPALINALGSIGAGVLGGGNKETPIQESKRKLIDRLLQSLDGEGAYSDLFNGSEEAFQKSFVDPAKSIFKNKIAPTIQQSYIASGQQRGTGLEDQLLRAGVDLDSLLNQQYASFQQDAMSRKQNAINSILGSPEGTQTSTTGQNALSALSGFLSSPGFTDATADIFNKLFSSQGTNQSTANPNMPTRKGFAPDWMDYNLGDSRWGQI